MEQIANELDRIDAQTPKFSETLPDRSPQNIPTSEQNAALLLLINRARALNGWKMKDFDALEPQILSWWKEFCRYQIPLDAYPEIFDMAFDIRMSEMGKGSPKDAPIIDAPLLVSCWSRPHGIKAQRELKHIEAGRTLSGNAGSQCPRCSGTGLETVYDIDGKSLGVRAGRQCQHEPLKAGEWLFAQRERAKDANVHKASFGK